MQMSGRPVMEGNEVQARVGGHTGGGRGAGPGQPARMGLSPKRLSATSHGSEPPGPALHTRLCPDAAHVAERIQHGEEGACMRYTQRACNVRAVQLFLFPGIRSPGAASSAMSSLQACVRPPFSHRRRCFMRPVSLVTGSASATASFTNSSLGAGREPMRCCAISLSHSFSIPSRPGSVGAISQQA